MATMHIDVVSAEEAIYSGEAEFVVLPGIAGELGIYPRHAPLITQIKAGTVRIKVKDQIEHTASEGDGPVNALDGALRKALVRFYPRLSEMVLVDYKVRVVNPRAGTAARVRVVIESRDGTDIWGTVGVSENIIEASWLALVDSIEYKLIKDSEASS